MRYEKLIEEKIEDLAFLELKVGTTIEINGEIFEGPLPLPILSNKLITVVKDKIEDVPIEMIGEGIIYVFALVPSYEYSEIYFEMLESYVEDVSGYIKQGAFNKLESEDYESSLVYIVALINLGYEDEKVLFALGNVLENIDISELNEEEKLEHAMGIMKIYEDSLNLNPEFSLAHYKLGYIYKEFGQFLKSKLTFEKALNYDSNDFRRQEIREVIESIEDDVLLETAITLMEKGKYNDALEELLKIRLDRTDDIVYYHLSLCYYNLGDIDEGINAIDSAIEINDIPVYHNQLALLYESSGDTSRAIEELENTIDSSGPDYLLNYNLATMQYNLGFRVSALTNFEIAYEQNPTEQLKEIIDYLKSN